MSRISQAIKSIFGSIKNISSTIWREIGSYTARFTLFGNDIYANEVVRASIRAISEHTSKANVKVLRRDKDGRLIKGNETLERMIKYRPNLYMNGKEFLNKIRTLYEIYNIVFIYIMRNESGKCIGLYPMPKAQYEAVEYMGELYIKFYFSDGTIMTHAWEDLAVIRKDYNSSDIFSDDNTAIITSLDLLNTTNEGMANAIKSTANLRGILKNNKAMINEKDLKAQKDRFVEDYMNMSNGSGIAVLDATQEFKELNLQPQLANYKNIEELRNNIYRYFGVNEKILMSNFTNDEWQAFYESKVEPFLLALGLELSYKIFSSKEVGFGNEIIFEANRMAYLSVSDKVQLGVQMVDRGAMTPNEWREVMNLSPIEGGDIPIRRLDTAPTIQVKEEVEENAI